MRRVRNVAALAELDNLPLALLFLDHRERSIGEVHVALCTCLKAASPPNHVHEAALVAVDIGDAERIDEAVLEGREGHAQRRIEGRVQSQRAIKIVTCVVKCEDDVFGEGCCVAFAPVGICWVGVET
jgi:hypothetical protein